MLLPPRGLVETLPLTSLLSCATLAARPGNWDPADHRGSRLGRTQYGSVGRTTFKLQERSLLRASRVCTPGLVSTPTLPSVIRGGYDDDDDDNNNNNDNKDDNDNDNGSGSGNGNGNSNPLPPAPPTPPQGKGRGEGNLQMQIEIGLQTPQPNFAAYVLRLS